MQVIQENCPWNLYIHAQAFHVQDRKNYWEMTQQETGQVLHAGRDPRPTWGQMVLPQEVSLPDICVRRKLI